jgi:hypothetical protein
VPTKIGITVARFGKTACKFSHALAKTPHPMRLRISFVWGYLFCGLRGLTQHKIWNKFHICKPQTRNKTAFYESQKQQKKQQTYIRQAFDLLRLWITLWIDRAR